MAENSVNMLDLRQALEVSWKPDTAYLGVEEAGNPALGQCYPTSRVFQHYFPEAEIVEGQVATPNGVEKHFWNLVVTGAYELHIDLSWQQFPPGSIVESWIIRDRDTLNDSPQTVGRVALLLERVTEHLNQS